MSSYMHGIAWDESLTIGHERVDRQHKRLFELLSNLVAACMDGSAGEKVQDTLNFLVNYTVEHFIDEEALQRETGFPGYALHKQLHEDFKVTVGGLVNEYVKNGSSEQLVRDVNKVVIKWLVYHIRIEDKKIGEHMAGK